MTILLVPGPMKTFISKMCLTKYMGKCLTNYRAVRSVLNEAFINIKCSAEYTFCAADVMFGLVELNWVGKGLIGDSARLHTET